MNKKTNNKLYSDSSPNRAKKRNRTTFLALKVTPETPGANTATRSQITMAPRGQNTPGGRQAPRIKEAPRGRETPLIQEVPEMQEAPRIQETTQETAKITPRTPTTTNTMQKSF